MCQTGELKNNFSREDLPTRDQGLKPVSSVVLLRAEVLVCCFPLATKSTEGFGGYGAAMPLLALCSLEGLCQHSAYTPSL